MPTRSRANPSGAETIGSGELDAVLGALSHPARRQIVVILGVRGSTMTAGQIADRFKHAWPTTTRHLGVLEDAGIIRVERQGRERHYTLNTTPVTRAAEWMLGIAALTPQPEAVATWANLPYASMRNTQPPSTKRRKQPRS